MVENVPAKARDMNLSPGSGRSPGEGNGNPLQYSCLGNPMDRGTWRATVHGAAKSQTGLRGYTTVNKIMYAFSFNICEMVNTLSALPQ